MSAPLLNPVTTPAGSKLFRNAFRAHPAGVAVITAAGAAGPVGLTASSVASVSADPPALAFSVSGGGSAAQVVEAETVLVHLMGAEQVDLVRAFATPGAPRFTEEMDWSLLPTGEPLLEAATSVLRCRIAHRMPVGGSLLVAANVLEIRQQAHNAEPLVYHDRSFHRISDRSRIA